MAGLGARLFPTFSKLTSAQVNGFLMDQTIMRFASATVRDAAFGGAGEPTLAEGMFCYLDDTNVLQSYNGSAWVSVAASSTVANVSSGLVFVAGASFSAVTEILIDSVFTSTYRNYRLMFDCQSSAGGGIFAWQVRSAGSTIATLTYNFSAMDISGTSITSRINTASSSIRFGANDASGYHASTIDIFCPQLALPTRLISAFNRNNANTVENAWSANTNSTSYDGFRISTSNGNMTGSFALYGYNQ